MNPTVSLTLDVDDIALMVGTEYTTALFMWGNSYGEKYVGDTLESFLIVAGVTDEETAKYYKDKILLMAGEHLHDDIDPDPGINALAQEIFDDIVAAQSGVSCDTPSQEIK